MKKANWIILILAIAIGFAPVASHAEPKTYAGRGALIGAGVGFAGGALGGLGLNEALGCGGEEENRKCSAGEITAAIFAGGAVGGAVSAGIGALIGMAIKRKPNRFSIAPIVNQEKTGGLRAGLGINATF